MIRFVKELPKGVELSKHLRDRAKGYMRVMQGGRHYYFPVTKEMKRVLNIRTRKGNLYIDGPDFDISDMLQDIASALYLQVRDDVCGDIEGSLMQELKERFQKMFEKPLEGRVMKEVNKKMLNPPEDR